MKIIIKDSDNFPITHTHTHTHTIYIYIYIYIRMCVCMCVCLVVHVFEGANKIKGTYLPLNDLNLCELIFLLLFNLVTDVANMFDKS